MAKVRKNALTPEQKEIYLQKAETLMKLAEESVAQRVLNYSFTSTNPRRQATAFEVTGEYLQSRKSALNRALDFIQSPKDAEDFSHEHLARFRQCCAKLRTIRYQALKHAAPIAHSV